jgi:carboxyl-terminal processing protease
VPIEDLRAFSEIFGKIKSDYVEPVEDKKLITEAINGMLTGLDPHSPISTRRLQGTPGGHAGRVRRPRHRSRHGRRLRQGRLPDRRHPAFRAGVKAGDLIIKLDDTPVKGMTLNDAVKRMRGKPGTDIVLTIVRKGEAKPLTLTLTRAVIKIKSVKHKLVEPGLRLRPRHPVPGAHRRDLVEAR